MSERLVKKQERNAVCVCVSGRGEVSVCVGVEGTAQEQDYME